jgi:hypothetical protein
MNTQLIKSISIGMLLSLFSGFSSFAMELEQPAQAEPIPISQVLRTDLGYTEHLSILNPTDVPIFSNILYDYDSHQQIFTQINAHQIPAKKHIAFDVTDFWNYNPTTSNSDRPEALVTTLSIAPGGAPIGTILFLMNNDETDLQVIVQIGSLNKTYNFDVTGVGDLYFTIFLADDSTKAPANFEKTDFQLSEQVRKGEKVIRVSKIYSKEEKKEMIEHFKKELELPRFKSERFGRPEIRLEHERLLKKFETKKPTIQELLEMQRK